MSNVNKKGECDLEGTLDEDAPHLFAPWSWGVVAVVGQVPCEDVELAGDKPPGLPHLQLVLGGQEGSELAGRVDSGGGSRALPVPQPAQRAVGDLQRHSAQMGGQPSP